MAQVPVQTLYRDPQLLYVDGRSIASALQSSPR